MKALHRRLNAQLSLGDNAMKCEYCDNEVPFEKERCPSCGALISHKSFASRETSKVLEPESFEKVSTKMMSNDGVDSKRIIRHKRWIYCSLGLFLGAFGVHNMYAGFRWRGIAQLLITLLSFLFIEGLWIAVWGLAIIEIISVTKDSNGDPLV